MDVTSQKRGPRSKGGISVRRKPSQERSQEKLDRILRETEKLLIKDGVDNIAISKITEAAGINIATFYRYFPNRHSMLRHLIEGYIAELRILMRGQLNKLGPGFTIEQFVETVTESVYEFFKANPAYVAVWACMQSDQELRDLDVEDTLLHAKDLSSALKTCCSKLDDAEAEDVALLFVLSASNVFRFASRRPPAEGRGIVDDWKRMAKSHLSLFV